MAVDGTPAFVPSGHRWERLRAVFHAAVEQPASSRSAFLARACDGDPSLQADVATLLRAHDEAGAFLESPVVRTAFTLPDGPALDPLGDPGQPRPEPRVISHYRLEDRLGAGGMGVVYRATDTALGREAALKILPDVFTPALRERLRHEADACARLQHPAIATYFESGEDGGVAFIAMELVRGHTLRARLLEGPLPVDDAVAITQCLLEALSHAHALGILHRDIKPENIIVTNHHAAKLVDFGIAKHLLVSEPDRLTAALTHGASGFVGTIGYMSPEQVRHETLDVRSDVFQVGAVFYEMLSGRPAFTGRTTAERLAAVLSKDPAPFDRPGVGPELTAVLERACSRALDRRYPSAPAFLSDLLKITAGEWSADLPAALAVLDFQNEMDAPADDWIGSGMAESLELDLARSSSLTVVARDKVLRASHTLRSTDPTSRAAELGLALGCRWVLTGTCRRLGPALRVTFHLVEAATGHSIAVETVDGTLDRIFEIQDQIAVTTRARLTVETSAGQSVQRRTTLSAYECYARGQRLATRLEKGSFDQARERFEQAVQQDPLHAKALAGLANIFALRHTYTTESGDLERAMSFARRATEADPTLAEPHVWLGYALMRSGRLTEAETSLRRARELNGSSFYACYFGSGTAIQLGRLDEGLRLGRRAVELEPNAGITWWALGCAHLLLGHFEDALSCFARTAQRNAGPDALQPVPGIGAYTGECLRRLGRFDEARARCVAALEEVERTDYMYRDTHRVLSLVTLGRITTAQGDVEAARAAFQQALAHIKGRPRMTAGGALSVQALAGLAHVDSDVRAYGDACRLHHLRNELNFSWVPLCDDTMTCLDLARAARALGKAEDARTFLDRAQAAGWVHTQETNW